MSLNIKEDTENILGRKYNVEYKLGNDSIQTFSNVLTNVDGTYFWFSSLENGLDVVQQDRVVTMICLERNKINITHNDICYKPVICGTCEKKTITNNGSFTGDGIFICYECQDTD